MDLREAIRTTGAVREFRPEPVERDVLTGVLDDARFAPSGGNRQPWRVAVVCDAARRREVADLMSPVWDEYLAARALGRIPFNVVDGERPAVVVPNQPNPLLDRIEEVPVVLAVAVDLHDVAYMDAGAANRVPITGGASIYPFCWNVLLAARARGLGGVMTTFLSAVEPAAAPLLRLPADHALAATIFLGYPVFQPTKLARSSVSSFTTLESFDGSPYDPESKLA